MHRDYVLGWSSALQRPMERLVFGHAGCPVLVFPTSRGRFHQWEDFGMIEALRHPLEQGWLQLHCVDGLDNETWYDFERPISQILATHEAYERYLSQELLAELGGPEFLIATGVSFGAFHAVNFACRHPGQVRRVVALSGDFDASPYLDGEQHGPAYFHNPVAYLGGTAPGDTLDRLRGLEFRLAVGAHDFCRPPTERLHEQLLRLGVRSDLQVWGPEWPHDWPTWRAMAPQLL